MGRLPFTLHAGVSVENVSALSWYGIIGFNTCGTLLSFVSHLQKGHVDASVRDLSDNLAESLALRPKLRNKVLIQSIEVIVACLGV